MQSPKMLRENPDAQSADGASVTVARRGDVAIVTLANPPVNALSHRLRHPLHRAAVDLGDDPSVLAIVIACAGRTFVAGADINEFGTELSRQTPTLAELCKTVESMDKPVIAAIHGSALGGGLELSMACHGRIADRNARLGLPEVKLGLIPGAGGTVRLPRLVPVETALGMIATGRTLDADEALACGLIDAVSQHDLLDAAVELARRFAAATVIPVRDRPLRCVPDPVRLVAVIDNLSSRTRGLEAPKAGADAVRNAVNLPFDEALKTERETFERLLRGSQSRAQRHLFFAERKARKVEGVADDTPVRTILKVGIVGAGTMGGGIAMALANCGIPTVILDTTQATLDNGLKAIRTAYDASVQRGSLTEREAAGRIATVSASLDWQALADCDLIIEAAYEDLAVKKEIFRNLDLVTKPGAILATNTSYLDVDDIASATARPQDVIGLHFFSPAHVMKLLEIVRAARTSTEVVATALALARRMHKIGVVVGVWPGFVGNRLLSARSRESDALLLEGALPWQIDRVFTEFGWKMGPFAASDLAGLDVAWRARKAQGIVAPVADAFCRAGRFGQKTGRGYYRYDGRRAEVDPEIVALIEAAAKEAGVGRRTISDDEIVERTMYPLVNAGAAVLHEKIAARASDIDLIYVNGYGFPVGKGGPMFWADETGLETIVAALDHWHDRTGREMFRASPLLRRLADAGNRITELEG